MLCIRALRERPNNYGMARKVGSKVRFRLGQLRGYKMQLNHALFKRSLDMRSGSGTMLVKAYVDRYIAALVEESVLTNTGVGVERERV